MGWRIIMVAFLVPVLAGGCASSSEPKHREVRIGAANSAQSGKASWYGEDFRGRPTASSEPYDPDALTAAHPCLPFGTRVVVTAATSGKSITVRINDRFGGHRGRIIDLSRASFERIAPLAAGVIDVRLEVVGP